MILTINRGLSDAVGHPDYPIRMGVAISVDSLQDSNLRLNQVEGSLSKKLQKDDSGTYIVSIAMMDGKQFKEFLFHTKPDLDFKTLHNELQREFPDLDVQFYAEMDPSWSFVKKFM